MTTLGKQTEARSYDWRPVALAGFALIATTFGVAGVWASVAKLDKAVIASGFVETESNRKTVQHLEGGIIRDILVQEGQHVDEGQALFRLVEVQAAGNEAVLKGQLDSSLALEARLLAERDGAPQISWPEDLSSRMADPRLAEILSDQRQQFEKRRASIDEQLAIIASKIGQLNSEISGIQTSRDSNVRQEQFIDQELVGLRLLASKQLVPVSRVFAMEREKTRLEGDAGQSVAEMAKAQGAIDELKLQSRQMGQKFQEDVEGALIEVRQKIDDLRKRTSMAVDVADRLTITAPRAGTAQSLHVFTKGQVIRSGEPLVDIVPDDEPLVVHAQFSPTDIDSVYTGMTAEIRFPAFHSRTIPVMMARIESVSRDRLIDDNSHQYYYLAMVLLNRAQIPDEYRSRVRAGMPVEVIASAGERTVLNYLVGPLSSALRTSMREYQE